MLHPSPNFPQEYLEETVWVLFGYLTWSLEDMIKVLPIRTARTTFPLPKMRIKFIKISSERTGVKDDLGWEWVTSPKSGVPIGLQGSQMFSLVDGISCQQQWLQRSVVWQKMAILKCRSNGNCGHSSALITRAANPDPPPRSNMSMKGRLLHLVRALLPQLQVPSFNSFICTVDGRISLSGCENTTQHCLWDTLKASPIREIYSSKCPH